MKTVAFLIYVTALVCYGDSKIPELTVDPSPEVIPTIEEFCDALTDAIKSVRKHEDDDEAFIDEYCEYIRIEHKLDIKEYDDLKDFKHLVVHYRQYKKWKKRVKKMNKKAKTIKVNGKVLKEVFGDTPFSDLTDDEMAKRFPKTEDTSEASDADTARRLIQHGCTLISGSAFASTNNQRETIISNSKCNIVKDQGPSNACWAFATAEQATCNYNTQKNGTLEFNVQHLLDCSSNTQGTKASGGFFDRASQWAESI